MEDKHNYTKREKRAIARGENKWIIRNAGKAKSQALKNKKEKVAGKMGSHDLQMKRLYQRFENKHGHEAKSVEKSIMRHGVKGVEARQKEHGQKMNEIFKNTD